MNSQDLEQLRSQFIAAKQVAENIYKSFDVLLSALPKEMPYAKHDVLMTTEEIAQELGWSERHFAERISKIPGFPKMNGKIWHYGDVIDWMRENGHKIKSIKHRQGRKN